MEGLGEGMLLLQGGEEAVLDRVLHIRETNEEWKIPRESSHGCHCSDLFRKPLYEKMKQFCFGISPTASPMYQYD
jgi:hypothetical protein